MIRREDVGKLAQKKMLTVLECKSISSEVRSQYSQYLERFVDFCKESGFHWPLGSSDIDPLLSDFMDTLYMEGKGPHEGEKTLAAVEFKLHYMKGKLVRARRCLKGWRKAMPPQSRLPMPRLAMFGVAMVLAAKGF